MKTIQRNSNVILTILINVVLTVYLSGQNPYNPNTGAGAGSKIADHTVVHTLWQGKISESAIIDAKNNLKIGYGHTSHGNQLCMGLNALVGFANDGNLGGVNYSTDLFLVSQNGDSGTLHIFNGSDYVDDNPTDLLSGDAGWPNSHFAEETREFLNDTVSTGINVIIWAWCGQLSITDSASLMDIYLKSMSSLEADYPNVTFVYMTGHLDNGKFTEYYQNINARNEQIRQYCKINNKWLFDFADIESYDPDGNCYLDKRATDGCNYDKNDDGIISFDASDPQVAIDGDGNWALEWESKHAKGTEWFACAADFVHTQQINVNMKAYAAWWLWARLGGWSVEEDTVITSTANDFNDKISVYPSYTDGLVNISILKQPEYDYTLKAFNSLGELIICKEIPKHVEQTEIDLSGNSSGVYYIVIRIQDKIFNYKAVKI